MRRSPVQSLAASPTMVGAVTTLIVIVAVFLAYNANNGLPFVPVYRVSVAVPTPRAWSRTTRCGSAATGSGSWSRSSPSRSRSRRRHDAAPAARRGHRGDATDTCCVAAKLNLKLDKTASPLPEDSIFRVRYRSSFGLKYLEIIRGTGADAPEGYTFDGLDDQRRLQAARRSGHLRRHDAEVSEERLLPAPDRVRRDQRHLRHQDPHELAHQPGRVRRRLRRARCLAEPGDRGAATPVRDLKPVSRVLAGSEHSSSARFFQALADTSPIVAPVATKQADFFTQAGIAFDAISARPGGAPGDDLGGPADARDGDPARCRASARS